MLKFKCSLKLAKVINNDKIFQLSRNFWYGVSYIHPNLEPGIYPYPKRQVTEKGKMSFQERINELHKENQEFMKPIDIGLSSSFISSENKASFEQALTRSDLEVAARNRTLKIDLNAVNEAWNSSANYLPQKCSIIEHYGIYNDLFEFPHFFKPIVHLNVSYGDDHPIYLGNTIPSQLAAEPPTVSFKYPGKWTILLTCPDEHLRDDNLEYVHWLYTVDTSSNSTQEIIPYLPPVPARGTGWHRYIFLLFRHDHDSAIDYNDYKLKDDSLDSRSFSTYEFYKRHQDDITPAGLAFFQSEWDSSVREIYHKVLKMEQPQFEFNWPRSYLPPQQRFPAEEAFDLYLDKYRDVKDINEEIVKERLKLSHPFDGHTAPPKYPNAVPFPKDMPSWLKQKENKKRSRQGIYNDLP